jgi:DsbC/DsbD-like thiol-disulfide interchange protein
MKKTGLLGILTAISMAAHAQILHPVKWSYAAKKSNKNEAMLLLKATIDEGWHIYSTHQKDGGPVKTSITFLPSKEYRLTGRVSEPGSIIKYDSTFDTKVSYFEKTVVFRQKIGMTSAHATIKGKIKFMTCNNQKCLPPEEVDFSIPVK